MAVRRINDSLLGPFERSVLPWIAERLPQRVLPDYLTILGLLGALVSAAGFVLSRWSLDWLYLS